MSKRSKSAPPRSRPRVQEIGSDQETVPSARTADPQAQVLYYHINGPSMRPTLKPGDLLEVVLYRDKPIRRGDIVVFYPPHEKRLVTHRLISVKDGFLRAQGDNNSRPDPEPFVPESIVGKVLHVQRRLRRRSPISGSAGHFYGFLIRGFNGAQRRLFYLGRPGYRWAARLGIFRLVWPFPLPTRVVSISRGGCPELQLLLGGRVIGKLAPHSGRWRLRPPFRLLIDERKLPRPDHPVSR